MEKFISLALETIKGVSDRLSARIDAIEKRALVPGPAGNDGPKGDKGEKGDAGQNGKDADPSALAALQVQIDTLTKAVEEARVVATVDIDAIVKAILPQLPQPNAEDGQEGRGVTPDELEALVVAHVDKRVAQIPVPNDGKSVTAEDVAPLVAELVEKKFADLPLPQNGKDGADGAPGSVGPVGPAGPKGDPGDRGEKGIDGKDGVGMAGALLSKDGSLVVTLSDGTVKDLGPVVGKDGAPGQKGIDGINGKDGADGFGFDDLDESLEDDGRFLVRTYKQGDRVKVFRHQQGIVLDRGVFAEGKSYQRGDSVTWGGSSWIAQEATKAKPGLATPESRAWRLSVKRGADGKEGRPGKDGAPGEKGQKGDPGPRGY